MADVLIGRPEMAAELHLTERQLTTLVKDGRLKDGTPFPSRVEGRGRKFYRDRGFDWYIRFKQEEAVARAAPAKAEPANDGGPKARLMTATAELAELKAARARGELVPLEDYQAELRRVLTVVRVRLLAMPGEFAGRLPADLMVGSRILREIARDVLAELRTAATALEEDPIEDPAVVSEEPLGTSPPE